ncbi:MAG: hypothetical protein GY806_21670 [Gammaproteobacteria bacterium]|nr:hypothetical protein [Gammaproteobacteria bacterium]
MTTLARKFVTCAMVLMITMFMAVPAASNGEVKQGHSCGCRSNSYSVYGAGQDSCEDFLKEYEKNPDSNRTDASYGQTLGWIAGYMSAANRQAMTRDIYSSALDYMTFSIARWCRGNPQATLSDAMDNLTDKLNTPGIRE